MDGLLGRNTHQKQIVKLKKEYPHWGAHNIRERLRRQYPEITCPAVSTVFAVLDRNFDDFIDYYNHERPHQALDMKVPADLYRESPRPYSRLTELEYPFHDRSAIVTSCGRICYNRQKINLSTVFAGQKVGIKQVDDRIWLVSLQEADHQVDG